MAASFPTSIKSFTTKVDNVTDVLAAHVNDLQDEVVALETALGAGVATALVQFQIGTVATVVTCSTAMVDDDTVPTNTEGTEVVTVAITPKSSSNILVIKCNFSFTSAGAANSIWSLCQDSTAAALRAGYGDGIVTNESGEVSFTHKMTAGTTSATTFKVRFGSAGTTMYVNGSNGSSSRKLGGAMLASLEVWELKV